MKFSKEETKYTDDHGDSPEQCSKCGHFEKDSLGSFCAVVAGKINPGGWCMKFYYKPTGFQLRPFMFREAS